MLTILIDIDQVTIEGVVIKRPDRIARSAWMAIGCIGAGLSYPKIEEIWEGVSATLRFPPIG